MTTALDALEAEMQELRQRMRTALAARNGAEMKACRAELQRAEAAWHALTGTVAPTAERPPSSIRERVLNALTLIGSPAPQKFISAVHSAFYDIELSETAMGTLRRDEQRSHTSTGNHRAYVCAALTADRFGVARGLLAHSAWPLEERIIAPTSRRVNLLRAVIRITEAAGQVAASTGTVPPLDTLLRGIPECDVPPRSPADLQQLRASVERALAPALRADVKARNEAARRARRQLNPVQQLFGAPRD